MGLPCTIVSNPSNAAVFVYTLKIKEFFYIYTVAYDNKRIIPAIFFSAFSAAMGQLRNWYGIALYFVHPKASAGEI